MRSDDKELYGLCVKRNWHKVERVCQSKPESAKYRGDEGSTPLHEACKCRPSVRVVQSLLAAYKAATDLPNAKNELPLHLACRYNASVSVLKELVKASPTSASYRTSSNVTAVNILCQARVNTETNHVTTNASAVVWHTQKSDLQEVNYRSLFWQKVQVLLEAVATHRQSNTNTLYILHAAVSLQQCCPLEVLDYALHKYPEQIRMRDCSGRLPLHIAVASKPPNADTSQALRKFQPKEQQLSCKLLEYYPGAAAECDPNEPLGRHPLHTALDNGHEWYAGIKKLHQHAPNALTERDPLTRLYPFQMAQDDLDSTYQLLRNMPSVLQDCSNNALVPPALLKKENMKKTRQQPNKPKAEQSSTFMSVNVDKMSQLSPADDKPSEKVPVLSKDREGVEVLRLLSLAPLAQESEPLAFEVSTEQKSDSKPNTMDDSSANIGKPASTKKSGLGSLIRSFFRSGSKSMDAEESTTGSEAEQGELETTTPEPVTNTGPESCMDNPKAGIEASMTNNGPATDSDLEKPVAKTEVHKSIPKPDTTSMHTVQKVVAKQTRIGDTGIPPLAAGWQGVASGMDSTFENPVATTSYNTTERPKQESQKYGKSRPRAGKVPPTLPHHTADTLRNERDSAATSETSSGKPRPKARKPAKSLRGAVSVLPAVPCNAAKKPAKVRQSNEPLKQSAVPSPSGATTLKTNSRVSIDNTSSVEKDDIRARRSKFLDRLMANQTNVIPTKSGEAQSASTDSVLVKMDDSNRVDANRTKSDEAEKDSSEALLKEKSDEPPSIPIETAPTKKSKVLSTPNETMPVEKDNEAPSAPVNTEQPLSANAENIAVQKSTINKRNDHEVDPLTACEEKAKECESPIPQLSYLFDETESLMEKAQSEENDKVHTQLEMQVETQLKKEVEHGCFDLLDNVAAKRENSALPSMANSEPFLPELSETSFSMDMDAEGSEDDDIQTVADSEEASCESESKSTSSMERNSAQKLIDLRDSEIDTFLRNDYFHSSRLRSEKPWLSAKKIVGEQSLPISRRRESKSAKYNKYKAMLSLSN